MEVVGVFCLVGFLRWDTRLCIRRHGGYFCLNNRFAVCLWELQSNGEKCTHLTTSLLLSVVQMISFSKRRNSSFHAIFHTCKTYIYLKLLKLYFKFKPSTHLFKLHILKYFDFGMKVSACFKN